MKVKISVGQEVPVGAVPQDETVVVSSTLAPVEVRWNTGKEYDGVT